MSDNGGKNTRGKPVAVVIGATSKWQAEGRNTLLAHGQAVDDSDVGSACAGASAARSRRNSRKEGFFTVVTTRSAANAAGLAKAIREQGGDCMIVELDLVSQDSIASAFATIRRDAGDPEVLIYNAGYLEGRDLPPEKELLEYVPVEMLDTGLHVSARGPFLVAQEVLPAMRKKGRGSFFFSNNSSSLRGRSGYRAIAVLSAGADARAGAGADRGIFRARHSCRQYRHRRLRSTCPARRALPRNQNRRDLIINPEKIAEAYWYLHTQDRSCWTHELQLTPFAAKPSY